MRYATKTWTLKEVNKSKIEALEMWVYRRILRVSWTEHRTNQSTLEELNIKDRAYLIYFGHIARSTATMQLMVVEGEIDRPKTKRDISNEMDKRNEDSDGKIST